MSPTVADLCFHGGAVPEGTPAEYQAYIQEMRDSFVLLDAAMQTVEGINDLLEEGNSLDANRVKSIFYVLYFGADDPAGPGGAPGLCGLLCHLHRGAHPHSDYIDEEGNEVETQKISIRCRLGVMTCQQVYAKDPASYGEWNPHKPAGQRGQRLQCREVRCI